MQGWVGTKAGVDAVKRKISHFPCRELNPGRPARSLVSILTEIPGHEILSETCHKLIYNKFCVKHFLCL
jgi:hypothetical protein